MHGLKAQKRLAQGKRSDTLGYEFATALTPCKVGCSKLASKARPLFGSLFIAIAVRRYSKTHI